MSLATRLVDRFRRLRVKPARAEAGALEGGRRAGEHDNPYLCARRTWNDHLGAVEASRRTWQMLGILALLIALAGVGGIIEIGHQSKFIPYVVEVDKLGQAAAVAPAPQAAPADPRVIQAAVAAFIGQARLVTPDVALQRNAVFGVYAMLGDQDPAINKMHEWLNGTEDSNPFARAAHEMVSVDIESVLAQTPETWQVDWLETTRDRQGVMKGAPAHMRALVTIYVAPPTRNTTEDQVRKNPLGVYVHDFSWSKQL